MQVVIHSIKSTAVSTLACARDTTLGKSYECRRFNKGEALAHLNGKPVMNGVHPQLAAEDSFLYVDDAGDSAELFLSDVEATFTD
jgi:hypothetical protein